MYPNMYPKIPTSELIPIIGNMSLNNQLDANTTHDLIRITSTIIEQNHFTFLYNNFSQITGLAMGAPSSAILSEIYLQHSEHTKTIDILTQHNVTGYFRYVDDILVNYTDALTDTHAVHKTLTI
jgi:hypothetical protein